MSEMTPIYLALVAIAVTIAYVAGASSGRDIGREKFLTFCTSQGVSYAACKEEWSKP